MKSCSGCIHENLESEDCMHCSRAYTDEYEKKEEQTNWERIRRMTIEELANFISDAVSGEINVTGVCLGDRCKVEKCTGCVLQWLEDSNYQ